MTNDIQKMRFTYLQKFLIKWQTRSLGAKIDTLMLILPVLVYVGRPNLDGQFQHAKAVIDRIVKPTNLALKVFDRVKVAVSEYIHDEKIYMQDRERAFDAIVEDIQFYSIVLDMLQDKGCETQRDIIHSVVQKAYDEEYAINRENKRILEYQEQAFR
ncbi:hypothetical protein [Helicobacter sp. 11S02596-1]|uniref:hypothetical protein n=1 Tax=Helicobacter sp. 11S02596-1 TaxID=1476194 RepID=UPI000BA582E3|nr:hypothetical protein [Helicobacter sp. 11S02596-1]PAF43612.1 hypothetical protein BJI48_04990 [Helicobacter sp. 11S02596-1]